MSTTFELREGLMVYFVDVPINIPRTWRTKACCMGDPHLEGTYFVAVMMEPITSDITLTFLGWPTLEMSNELNQNIFLTHGMSLPACSWPDLTNGS